MSRPVPEGSAWSPGPQLACADDEQYQDEEDGTERNQSRNDFHATILLLVAVSAKRELLGLVPHNMPGLALRLAIRTAVMTAARSTYRP